MTSIYVGNLPYQITEDELNTAFTNYGEVSSAKIIMDRETGRSTAATSGSTKRNPRNLAPDTNP